MIELSEGKYAFTKNGEVYYIKEVVIPGKLYKAVNALVYGNNKSICELRQEDIDHFADEVCKKIDID